MISRELDSSALISRVRQNDYSMLNRRVEENGRMPGLDLEARTAQADGGRPSATLARAPWPHDFCRQACRRPRLRCTRTQASWRTTCWPAVCSRASIWTSPPPLTTGTSTRRAPRSPRRAAAWIAWVGAEPCTATVAAQRTTRLDGTIPAPASPPSLHLHLLFLLHHRLLYFLHHRESPSSLRSPPITPDLAPPGTPSWPRSTR